MIAVSVTFKNDNPKTVWNMLAEKLEREPTNEEARLEVIRIIGKVQS
jgi:hypothetical protein